MERCSGAGCNSFVQIASTPSAPFADSGLTAATSYSYRVRATDAAGNLSGYSNIASGVTNGTNITVSVSPLRAGLTISQTLSITATLTNDMANQGVNWSFTSTGSATGGSFSASSSTSGIPVVFTAPFGAGVVTITATAVGDISKAATATIGVTDLSGVTTYLNNNSRQGANTQEYALTTSGNTAVNSTNFGKLFSCTVDAAIYAQPLWVPNLQIAGGTHNVVFVATERNSVYAFDADSSSCTNLWGGGKSLNPSGQTSVTSGDVACQDLTPDVGITGTPVIDTSSGTMYVVTKSKDSSSTFHQSLHALDITSGTEKFSGPKEISASVAGTGVGSSGGQVSFDPLVNNQRGALLLSGGHVIIAWASHCDNGAYHGWVMSYGASSLAQEAVFNTSPNGINSGVWMAGNGPAADASGNIYFAIGNGTFDANSGSAPNNDFGDAIVKLGAPIGGAFPVISYFRPFTLISPDNADTDQGSGGLQLLPAVGVNNHVLQAGKDGNIYVLDQSNLGGYSSSSNNVVQEIAGAVPGGMWGSPAYWNGNVYFGAAVDPGYRTCDAACLSGSDPVRAFAFDTASTATLSISPTSVTSKMYGYPGPTPTASSQGTSNGILWVLENLLFCTNFSTGCGPAVLHAYDATNLTTEFWNSSQNASDAAGNAVKFTVPVAANGKVYVGTRGNDTGAGGTSVPGELDVYGLKP